MNITKNQPPTKGVLICTRGGIRTHKPLLATDFKSVAYTVPPPGQVFEVTGRIELP